MAMNLQTPTEVTGASHAQDESSSKRGPAMPTPAEIAAHFPQFEILECLGRGGMGMVYKARQPRLNRLVALKILTPDKEHDPKFAERFVREAQALARLNHPGIVTVHDFGEAGGMFYLLMEYVDGVTLRTLLRQGQVKPEEALAIVPKICEALQYAHQQGIIHRDIKPENILLDKQGRVKIADFGIAKLIGQEGRDSLTGARGVVGTPHYMAPEQVEHPQTVDHRADIYSLGVVFYELLTGELPLGRFAPPSSRVQVDVRLDEVVLRALEKEPERRYQQADQVKTAVETLVAHPETPGIVPPNHPPAASAVTPTDTPGPIKPRYCTTAVVGAVCVIVFICSLVFVFLSLMVVRVQVAAGSPPPQPPLWAGFLKVFFVAGVLPTSVVTPILATILGWIAVGKIRRSNGQLYGLGLAVFDGLFMPLLALDGLLAWLIIILVEAIGDHYHPGHFQLLWGRMIPLILLICAVLDACVIGWVWRKVKHPWRSHLTEGTPSGQEVGVQGLQTGMPSQRRSFWISLASGLVLCGVILWLVWRPKELGAARAAMTNSAMTTTLAEDTTDSGTLRDRLNEAPPVVIHTVPEAGAVDVDPSLSEIQVTFSKPMAQKWAWSSPFPGPKPEETASPRFLEDQRTWVLPVRLQPGQVYTLRFNDDVPHAFMDKENHDAVPYVLIFETRKPTKP